MIEKNINGWIEFEKFIDKFRDFNSRPYYEYDPILMSEKPSSYVRPKPTVYLYHEGDNLQFAFVYSNEEKPFEIISCYRKGVYENAFCTAIKDAKHNNANKVYEVAPEKKEILIDTLKQQNIFFQKNPDRQWLFRGQEKSTWELESTLFRGYGEFLYKDYMCLIDRNLKQINKNHNENEFKIIVQKENDNDSRFDEKTLKTLVYLRHHGFPSPLMDWTRCPFVAAYFAFNSCCDLSKNCGYVAIFVIRTATEGGWVGDYNIELIDGEIQKDKSTSRHHAQKAVYTLSKAKKDDKLRFGSSNKALINYVEKGDFIKILIPYNLQKEFMQKLQIMEINAYSLFNSEDALIKSLWEKEAMESCFKL